MTCPECGNPTAENSYSCAECNAAFAREPLPPFAIAWLEEQKVRQRPRYRRAWAKRRALRAATEGSFTKEDIDKLYQLQRGKCWWCGAKLDSGYHIDHRVPLPKGEAMRRLILCWPAQIAIYPKGQKCRATSTGDSCDASLDLDDNAVDFQRARIP